MKRKSFGVYFWVLSVIIYDVVVFWHVQSWWVCQGWNKFVDCLMFYNKNLFQILLLLLWSECSSCVGTHFQELYSNAWSEDFERSMPLTRHLGMENCWSNPTSAWSGVPKQVYVRNYSWEDFDIVTSVSDDQKDFWRFSIKFRRKRRNSIMKKVLEFTFESFQL